MDVEENFDGTTTYTFHLRSARWSDGQAVTADDFVYAWQRLANPLTLSPNAELLSAVQGYDAVRAGGDPSKLAVTAKNDSTLEVVLSGKYDWFLTEVCTAPATSPLRQDVIQSLKESAQTAAESAGEGAAPLKWWHAPAAAQRPANVVAEGTDIGALGANASQSKIGGAGLLQNFQLIDGNASRGSLHLAALSGHIAQLPAIDLDGGVHRRKLLNFSRELRQNRCQRLP